MTLFLAHLSCFGMARLSPGLESLTGVKFEKLLEQVPALKNAMGKEGSKSTAQG